MNKFAVLMVLVIIMMNISKRSLCFPLNIRVTEKNDHDGRKMIISNMEQQRNLLNHSVPTALLSNLSPPEYLKKQGLNTTSDNPTNFLSFLLSTQESTYSAQQIQTGTSCPVQWVIDFEANRIPASIQKAVCNLQGTTCLTIEGWPSCEEFRVKWRVQRFLGITRNGEQIWQVQYQSFPIACNCPSLT